MDNIDRVIDSWVEAEFDKILSTEAVEELEEYSSSTTKFLPMFGYEEALFEKAIDEVLVI